MEHEIVDMPDYFGSPRRISSYPKIYALGHKAIRDIFSSEVQVEEKVDGSQFSWGIFEGELRIRSKNAIIHPEAPPKMFVPAVEYVLSVANKLVPDFIYRGEYLSKCKHNTLCYDRIPNNHIIIFDISSGIEDYVPWVDKQTLANDIGLETVPTFEVTVSSLEELLKLLKTESCLGGGPLEGIVVKNYDLFTTDKKVMMGKLVREEFKERNQKNWAGQQTDVVDKIVAELAGPARWLKAIQAFRDNGTLLDAPQDIGPLLKHINLDILEEEKEWIKDMLFKAAWPKIAKRTTSGFPNWYKEQLAAKSFLEKE